LVKHGIIGGDSVTPQLSFHWFCLRSLPPAIQEGDATFKQHSAIAEIHSFPLLQAH